MALSFIIRFQDAAIQPSQPNTGDGAVVKRVVGVVAIKHLLPLFHKEALDPNPRSARVNRVTKDIVSTLKSTPELFRFKSKGVLIGSSKHEALQRNRFRVEFGDTSVEGALDGGHNLLAIGLFILEGIVESKVLKSISSWDDLMKVWLDYKDLINKADFDIGVPVELLVPANEDQDTVESFKSALIDICSARNNNAQLPQEAAANKKGFYDEIKSQLPPDFAARVEWRPNTWEDAEEDKPIQVRDLLALAWIPLNLLNDHNKLPEDFSVSPQNIYRNKGECSKLFEQLMSHAEVTEEREASRRELIHDGVRSAFKVLGDLPELYDLIYEQFPDAYNKNSKRFRANPIVKLFDPEARNAARAAGKDISGYTATAPTTPFLRRNVKAAGTSKPCSYPDGLIVPLVYGLQGLMKVSSSKVVWAVSDPKKVVTKVLPDIAASYQLVLDMGKWDPQKIAKNPASHEFAVQQFRTALRGLNG
jgi:hypothetical protein